MLKFTLVFDNDTTVHDLHTYTVAFSPQLTKKERDPPLPRVVVERIPEAEPKEVVRFVQRWQRMEERSNHTMAIVENESERSLREP